MDEQQPPTGTNRDFANMLNEKLSTHIKKKKKAAHSPWVKMGSDKPKYGGFY